MSELYRVIFTTDFFYSILRVTTPILFAAMGAVVANTAGIPNIALEGIMLLAAFLGMLGSAVTGNAWFGLFVALAGGVLCAGVIAFFTLYYRTKVILAGIAINSLASGGTVILLYLFTGDKGTSASVASGVLPRINIPLLKSIPVLGDVLSGHHVLTYLSILSVIVVYLLIKKTPLGFHMRAVGKDPNAAESVGINVMRIKVQAVLISGLFASFGGVFMSMGYVSWFSRDMIAGRGWIAVAAEAMGRTTVVGTAVTSLLFGIADAFSNSVSALGWPSELVKTIPYCATLVGLIIFSIRTYRQLKAVRR
ncbi:MAG: ABC transporter permease [Hungatella sp.]|jgi:simple sugar transport system permease protein|nr:ABC transporter permease [Hungatella sp.]